jgi:transcription antitermination factor NusG
MRRLYKSGISFYGPVIEKQHRSPAGRSRTSFVPLFPNYVFLHGDEVDRYEAICTGCVSQHVEVTNTAALFDDLRRIHELIQVGETLVHEPEIPVGTRVRVMSGALEGQVGTIIERRGKQRLLVAVDFLQQGASVELESLDVEPL